MNAATSTSSHANCRKECGGCQSAATEMSGDWLHIRIHGDASLPTLIYLPGLHGDWTLVSSFRAAMAGKVRFVEFVYPCTTTWSLDDYATAVEGTLEANGISSGWLLGESFGSQIAWQLIGRSAWPTNCAGGSVPRYAGLILAGGFVKHPFPCGVRGMQRLTATASGQTMRGCFRWYARYAKFRHRSAPETLASIDEFVANRLRPGDRAAAVHRLELIKTNDLRPVARQAALPVYYLAGLIDPLVPWCYERWWLRCHCPGYRQGRTLWRADHNVLGTAPAAAAAWITSWIRSSRKK